MRGRVLGVPIAAAIIWAFILALPAVSGAQQTPCENGNPTDLCGDGIVVVEEPAGENCPAGGIKIIVVNGRPDDEEEPDENGRDPKPDEPDDVFYVCNGVDGEDGEDGETPVITVEPAGENCPAGGIKIEIDGESFYVCNGVDGQDGEDGDSIDVDVEPAGENCPAGGFKITVTSGDEDPQVFYVCNGEPTQGPVGPIGPIGPIGPAGPGGPAGPAGPSQPIAPTCVNTRRVVAMGLPSRFGKYRGVRIRIDGNTQRRRVLFTERRNVPYARVTTSTLTCGVYAVIARHRGERAYPMVWTFKGGKRVVKTRIGGFHKPTPNG